MADYLIQFICPACKEHIAWALPKATVICPLCARKVNAKSMKTLNPATLSSKSEQLSLFADY